MFTIAKELIKKLDTKQLDDVVYDKNNKIRDGPPILRAVMKHKSNPNNPDPKEIIDLLKEKKVDFSIKGAVGKSAKDYLNPEKK